jgi:CheY-like chemotaxis protein
MTAHAVLIVDDEAAIRMALRRWFERRGWRVDEAADGETAVTVLSERGQEFSLVVCDLHLPIVDGEEIARRVGEAWPDLLERFVFSTGDAVEHAPDGSILRSHAHVLPKPFEFAQLKAMIETVVGPGSAER